MAITKGTRPIGMISTKITLVKIFMMEVSNDGCDWSLGSRVPDYSYLSYTI